MKLPYSEGTLFFGPLRTGGFAREVVTRVGNGGKVLFGYFFGPRLPSATTMQSCDLDPAKAILRLRFGDLGLINGEWPIVGTIPNWDRSRWPISNLVRGDALGKRAPVIVRYSDSDPSKIESELVVTSCPPELGADSLSGYGAVEIKLTKMLA